MAAGYSLGISQPLPDFKINSLRENQAVSRADLQGKAVVFCFWNNDTDGWQQQKVLRDLQQKYPGRLMVLSASLGSQDQSALKKKAVEENWNFDFFKAGRGFKEWSVVSTTPYLFIADPSGDIRHLALGFQDLARLDSLVYPYLPVVKPAPVNPSPQPEQPRPYIILYGRPGCGNCQAMRARLEQASQPYQFLDVDKDNKANQTMWKKLKEDGLDTGKVMLPVMEVNGYIFSNPTYQTVQDTLKKPVKIRPKKMVFQNQAPVKLEKPSGRVGNVYADFWLARDHVLSGLTVWYTKDRVVGLQAHYSRMLSSQKLDPQTQKSSRVLGSAEGQSVELIKPGYYISGLRTCEGLSGNIHVVKKISVIWKKWGDVATPPEVSDYAGYGPDTDICLEIRIPEGKTGIGIHGTHFIGYINQLSLIAAEVIEE